ncbi:MAG: transcription antitermination factor NusB [Planctomycetota bacterium]
MSHPKTAGRELALQYLYMHDVLEGKDVQPFDMYIKAQDIPPERQSVVFAESLVESVLKHSAELDAEIAEIATNWNIKRMAAVDRNVLRLGLAELTICPETPNKVILNEAVELAKQFSSDEAGAFVNGLLDKLCSKRRPEPAE